MTNRANGWLDRNVTRITMATVAGTCVSLLGFAWLTVQNRQDSSQGAKARERQMRVYPISVKVYEDAARRHVITADDLECFKTGRKCPPVPTRTP